ncbi:MAG TPA: hypothetical protein VFA50_14395 [Stellaceae bacterium]|nr:hypothetical protein [Stellaceae bacterium]
MSDIARKSATGHLAGAAASHLSPHNTGVALGAVIGGWHLLWAIVAAAGWGQPLLDFVFWMHFMKPGFVIDSFSLVRAVVLIAVTAAGGYGFGYMGTAIWNRLRSE